MYQRRLLACMLGGFIAGSLCLAGRQLLCGAPEITWDTVADTMANRLLLGFVIALSGWRISHFPSVWDSSSGKRWGFLRTLPQALSRDFSSSGYRLTCSKLPSERDRLVAPGSA